MIKTLDNLIVQDAGSGGSITAVYQTPGTQLKILVFASCVQGTCPASIAANFTIYGR